MTSGANSTLNHPLLPECETRALIAVYRTGDNAAAERLIAHNERAIFRLARRYYATGVCGDVPMDDLMQMGRMGILRAMQDFDLDSDNTFMTYAWGWIRSAISRAGKHEGQQVALSYRATEHRGAIGKVVLEFVQRNHRQPTLAEIAGLTKWSEKYITSLRVATVSLDETHRSNNGNETRENTMLEYLIDRDADPARESEDRLVCQSMIVGLRRLPRPWRTVLTLFYGLNGKEAENLKSIARQMNISSERVRQIRDSALEELRRTSNY
jgi:RNA polymerase primary sigma factor